MNKTSNFKGVINGKEYNSKEDYMKALEKIFNEEETPITSISFDEEENYEEEDEDESEYPCYSCECRDCKDESINKNKYKYCDKDKLEDVKNGLMHSEHLNKLLTHNHMVFDYLFPYFENFDSPMFVMMKDPFTFDNDEMKACEDSMRTVVELTEPFKQKILNIINQMNKEEIIAYYRLIENIIMNIKRTMVGIDIHKQEVRDENTNLTLKFANNAKQIDSIKAEIARLELKIKQLKETIRIQSNTEEKLTDNIEHNKKVISHLNSFKNIMLKFNSFYDEIYKKTNEITGKKISFCKLKDAPDKPYTLDKGDCGKDPATEAPIKTSSKEVEPQKTLNINDLLNTIFEDPYMTGNKKVTTKDIKKMLNCAKNLFGNTNGFNEDLFNPLNNEVLNKSIIPSEEDAKNFLNILFGKNK